MPDFEYHVFISYAREEQVWVEANLLKRFLKCRIGGLPPRIFFDASVEGIRVGVNWRVAAARGLERSRFIVPVYSKKYFEKRECQWELGIALDFDPTGQTGRLCPILKDPGFQVPLHVKQIHYLTLDTVSDWFERLCRALEFVPATDEIVLRFPEPPPREVFVNHTLPPVRVELAGLGGSMPSDQEVTLTAEKGDLRGMLTVRSHQGVAVFKDVSFGTSTEKPIRLAAAVHGFDPVHSEPFRVVVPPPPPVVAVSKPTDEIPRIKARGEVVFLPEGSALVVISAEQAQVWDLKGHPHGEPMALKAQERLRLVAADSVVRADWNGTVQWLFSDGRTAEWPLGNGTDELAVPGGLAMEGAHLWVGFWSGKVFRLRPGQPPELVLTHDPGVQALAVVQGRLCIAGLDGVLAVCQEGKENETHPLESTLHLLKAYSDRLVAVGEHHLFQYRPNATHPSRQILRTAGVSAVLGDGDCPVVIDAKGAGLRFNFDLAVLSRFHVAPGAVPVSADHAGQWTVLLQPDGVRILLDRSKAVFTHALGTLAVSHDGSRFALGEGEHIRLITAEEMQTIIHGGRHA